MQTTNHQGLSRRERQILDILYQRGQATAAEVQTALPEPPSYSAVRALLRILEQKGHVRHEEEGRAYVYLPAVRRDAARQHALSHLLKTFFDNSAEQAVAALLAIKGEKMSEGELDRMSKLIDAAKKEGR
jgi:BlaI family transcriptional regulator, penicillinase repressor